MYIVTDYQNKPRRGIDAATQQIVWSWDPDAFGVLQPASGLTNGVEMNLRFPGQYYDIQSGLYYNHNRYYNPELGRYMEPDPLGLEGGLNPYSYVSNNPTNMVDPSGLFGIADDAAMRAAVGAPDFNLMNFSINAAINSFQNKINSGSTYSPVGTGTVLAPKTSYSSSPNSLLVRTAQTGIVGSGTLALGFGVNLNLSAGLASDGNGARAIYITVGSGAATGAPGAYAGVQTNTSNAPSITDLRGWAYTGSVGGGFGPNVTIDGFVSKDSSNKDVLGGGATVGVGAGLGGSAGKAYTWLIPFMNSGRNSRR